MFTILAYHKTEWATFKPNHMSSHKGCENSISITDSCRRPRSVMFSHHYCQWAYRGWLVGKSRELMMQLSSLGLGLLRACSDTKSMLDLTCVPYFSNWKRECMVVLVTPGKPSRSASLKFAVGLLAMFVYKHNGPWPRVRVSGWTVIFSQLL